MSHLRDAKIIKTIAESTHCSELSEEACRYILANVELILRRVVIDVAKYARKFNRSRLRLEDVDLVLSDLNLAFLTLGLTKPVANQFTKPDKTHFELDKEELDIREETKQIIGRRLFQKKKVELSFDWLSIGGRWNPLLEGASTADHSVFTSADKQSLVLPRSSNGNTGANNSEPDREILAQYDYFSNKGGNKSTFLVKELNPNVLTKEAGDFFETFRRIVEDYFQLIDENLVELDFRRFYYG